MLRPRREQIARSFGKHIVSCAPAAVSLSPTASSAPANCEARRKPSTASSVTAGSSTPSAEVDKFTCELERIGFREIVVERMQARVTPSVLHVPWVTLKFLLTTVVFGERKMTRARWNNVLAPILLPFVGFPLGPIAYYIISATRI